MIDKLKLFLRHYSPSFFYSFARHCYWEIRRLEAIVMGTKIEEKKWTRRNFDEIKGDFTNLNHPHRQFLIEEISSLRPINSILEIGCGYGPNLYLLAKRFPETELVGIDINPLSIREGRKWVAKEGISNVKLLVGKADEISQFQNKEFDIVFTDATLIYIGPDKIKGVIQKMINLTRKALVLLEWHYQNGDPQGLGIYHFGHWKRNYKNLLKQFVPENRTQITKIPENLWPVKDWEELGHLIEVLL